MQNTYRHFLRLYIKRAYCLHLDGWILHAEYVMFEDIWKHIYYNEVNDLNELSMWNQQIPGA